jgi:hypothetical protein
MIPRQIAETENAMTPQNLTKLHQSEVAPTLAGTWKLGAGRAMTLRPREAGTLRVARGRIWATQDGPHGGVLDESGDQVLGAGEQLSLRPGQRLVVEAWSAQAPAYFSWTPLPEIAPAAVSLASVLQPLAELRLALALGAGATVRLAAGLAGLAWALMAGRSRAAGPDRPFRGEADACASMAP